MDDNTKLREAKRTSGKFRLHEMNWNFQLLIRLDRLNTTWASNGKLSFVRIRGKLNVSFLLFCSNSLRLHDSSDYECDKGWNYNIC